MKLLTTIDNPYNPFSNWDEWFMTDLQLGYDTCGLLARVSNDSGITEEEIERAMTEVITHNLSGRHIIVTESEFELLMSAAIDKHLEEG